MKEYVLWHGRIVLEGTGIVGVRSFGFHLVRWRDRKWFLENSNTGWIFNGELRDGL